MFSRFLKKFSGQSTQKDEAKKRLHFALVYDKLEINDSTLKELQSDIVGVISKYFEIDQESIHLEIQRDEDTSALVFNTPIINVKRSRA
ncbi:MAG: cell division topological specificity factor MinE [Desulfobacteraceae bacterium]